MSYFLTAWVNVSNYDYAKLYAVHFYYLRITWLLHGGWVVHLIVVRIIGRWYRGLSRVRMRWILVRKRSCEQYKDHFKQTAHIVYNLPLFMWQFKVFTLIAILSTAGTSQKLAFSHLGNPNQSLVSSNTSNSYVFPEWYFTLVSLDSHCTFMTGGCRRWHCCGLTECRRWRSIVLTRILTASMIGWTWCGCRLEVPGLSLKVVR